MSYGSTSFGSASLGGAVASMGTLYFRDEILAEGTHRRSLEYLGDAEFFAVESRVENEPVDMVLRILRIYSHNDPSETSQLQVVAGADAFYSQSIIGAARFIVVELELMTDLSPIGVTVTGSEYFQ